MNKREFRVMALERTGHNGIINWMLNAFDKTNTCFYSALRAGTKLEYRAHKEWTWGDHKTDNELFVYSLLNRSLTHFNFKIYDQSLPKAEQTKIVVLLRELRNWIASVTRHNETRKQPVPMNLKLWTQYAEQILGHADHLKTQNNVVYIVYDHWFTSSLYRWRKANQLNIPLPDWQNIRIDLSGYSSFKNDDTISDTDYLNRWQHYEKDDKLNKLLTPERLALNEKLMNLNYRLFSQ